MGQTTAHDLPRTLFSVLCLGGLLVASFWILQPFLAPLGWAVLLVAATWPVLRRIEARCGNRRWLAVLAMMALLLLAFMLPCLWMLSVLIDGAPAVVEWVQRLFAEGLPGAPRWLDGLPLLGETLAERWDRLAAAGPDGLAARIQPHAQELAAWLIAQLGGAGMLLLHFALTLLLAGILYARGEAFSGGVRRFAWRLAGDRGDLAVMLAAQSVRAVAYGVVVTALLQSVAGGLGLLVAGVPAVALLTAVMFLSSIAQLGAAPVVVLAAVWLFFQDRAGAAIAVLAWAVLVGSLDNVVRPVLIRRGVDLPMILVFAGVIGGLIGFGPVGLFAGPVALAVGHNLLASWLAEGEGGPLASAGRPADPLQPV